MDKTEILLGSKESFYSEDKDNKVSIELSSNVKPLHNEQIVGTFDQYQQYLSESDASNKYRMIFTLRPLLSNVLFNMFTEMVYKEGDENNCIRIFEETEIDSNSIEQYNEYTSRFKISGSTINYKYVSRENLLKDTAYSHADIGPITYHCGYDIFNNHTLRQRGSVLVNKLPENGGYNRDNFNTMWDFKRDNSGNVINEEVYGQNGDFQLIKIDKGMHLYNYDTLLSFKESMRENLIENNAWFGFKNSLSMSAENYAKKGIILNKTINDKKPCEFIDMYPDRSLFSFFPKKNEYKNQMENNWDYCLSYPSSNDYDNPLISRFSGNTLIFNGPQVYVKAYDVFEDNEGEEHLYEDGLITFTSYIKHNLKVGDRVTLFFFYDDESYEIIKDENLTIERLGYINKEEENTFAIKTKYIQDYLYPENPKEGEEVKKVGEIRFAKVVDDVQSEYYFRLFKHLKPNNFKNEFNTSLNKLAFAKTIYNEENLQIVYNDEINVEGLTDNLGRPLSEIYLSIFKRNKGWEKWYDSGATCEDVEFSHCFGKVTEGMDLIDEIYDYNIHYLHNVNIDEEGKIGGYENVWGLIGDIKSLNDNGITYDEYIGEESGGAVYGDLVEFTPAKCEEITLEDIYHRFNTVQREYTGDLFKTMFYNEIIGDDYDMVNNDNISFEIGKYEFTTNKLVEENNPITPLYRVNVCPEGYYYKPHYKITLKEYKNVVNVDYHEKIYFEYIDDDKTKIRTLKSDVEIQKEIDSGIHYPNRCKEYYLENGEYLLYFNKLTHLMEGGEEDGYKIVEIIDNVTFKLNKPISTDGILFKINHGIPDGAVTIDDENGKFVWRDFKTTEEKESEGKHTMFTNDTHYIYDNINFLLKRQDPIGKYGLSQQDGDYEGIVSTIVKGKSVDTTSIDYKETKKDDVC